MWEYLKLHEAFVRKALLESRDEGAWRSLRDFHLRQIRFMQHERLIHLLVLLTMAVLLLASIGFSSVHPTLPGFGIAVLLLILVSAYVVHYFRLENGVQRWYHLANQLDEKVGEVSGRYNEDHPGGWFGPRPGSGLRAPGSSD